MVGVPRLCVMNSENLVSRHWLAEVSLAKTLDDFKFLPTFLLVFYIRDEISRWLLILESCWNVQGRINDIAVFLGMVRAAAQSACDILDAGRGPCLNF